MGFMVELSDDTPMTLVAIYVLFRPFNLMDF